MASISSVLPKLFRWFFTIMALLTLLCAVIVIALIVIDPRIPAGLDFGPKALEFMGQPGSMALRSVGGDYDFTVNVLRGNLVFFVAKASGLLDVVKRYGLPLGLVSLIFLAVLFDLLRRLFRNVGRGESFSAESVRLVQFVGGALILYSFVSAFAEHWFAQAVFAWLVGHATVTVSGTPLHLPAPGYDVLPRLRGPFGSPAFFSGLLVLALSEVFRQGLALKTEHDLTV